MKLQYKHTLAHAHINAHIWAYNKATHTRTNMLCTCIILHNSKRTQVRYMHEGNTMVCTRLLIYAETDTHLTHETGSLSSVLRQLTNNQPPLQGN